jgi:hypothetical protein
VFEGAQEFQKLAAFQFEKCADFLAMHRDFFGSKFRFKVQPGFRS